MPSRARRRCRRRLPPVMRAQRHDCPAACWQPQRRNRAPCRSMKETLQRSSSNTDGRVREDGLPVRLCEVHRSDIQVLAESDLNVAPSWREHCWADRSSAQLCGGERTCGRRAWRSRTSPGRSCGARTCAWRTSGTRAWRMPVSRAPASMTTPSGRTGSIPLRPGRSGSPKAAPHHRWATARVVQKKPAPPWGDAAAQPPRCA
jgi:hypothetical protein